jgi:exonuclease III
MRIVAWNIRAGGGRRISGIARQIERWQPQVVTLSEFRATPPSRSLAQALSDQGLSFQLSTADTETPRRNAMLIASIWPIKISLSEFSPNDAHRWLLGRIQGPRPFYLGAMHVPNRVTGRKYDFQKSVIDTVLQLKNRPALIAGDTNSGIPKIDEQSPAFNQKEADWIRKLEKLKWQDAFRFLHGNQRVYSWYSPNAGNGFRLDQAFINPHMIRQLKGSAYFWGRPETASSRRDALSDHAALILDFE